MLSSWKSRRTFQSNILLLSSLTIVASFMKSTKSNLFPISIEPHSKITIESSLIHLQCLLCICWILGNQVKVITDVCCLKGLPLATTYTREYPKLFVVCWTCAFILLKFKYVSVTALTTNTVVCFQHTFYNYRFLTPLNGIHYICYLNVSKTFQYVTSIQQHFNGKVLRRYELT